MLTPLDVIVWAVAGFAVVVLASLAVVVVVAAVRNVRGTDRG